MISIVGFGVLTFLIARLPGCASIGLVSTLVTVPSIPATLLLDFGDTDRLDRLHEFGACVEREVLPAPGDPFPYLGPGC